MRSLPRLARSGRSRNSVGADSFVYNPLVVLFQRPGEKHHLNYFLVVVFADGTTETYPISEAPLTLGRSPDATICLKEEAVSRQHCVVSPSHGRLTLLDQGSTNGTRVNGKKVRQARLSHGDIVEVGATRIRVQARTAGGSLIDWPEDIALYAAPLPAHEHLALLRRLAARLAIARTTSSVVAAVVDIVFEAFPVESVVIVLRRAAGVEKQVDVLAARRRDGAYIDSVDLDDHVVDRVITSGHAERHLAVLEDEVEQALDEHGSPTTPSKQILCSPMRHGREAFGVLYLESPEVPEWVGSDESLALLAALSDIAGLALTKTRMSRVEGAETSTSSEHLRETIKVELADHIESGQGPQDDSAARDEIARISQLVSGDAGQRQDVEELQRSLERRMEERTEVIETQRIELAARLSELEHLQRTRAMMSRGLVHDIRNLVSALNANLSFVQLDLEEGSEEAVSLEAALGCSRRIVSMAEDILDVSRMEEGSFPLESERIQVRTLMNEVIARHQAQARDVAVSLELGDVDAQLRIYADPDVMARVLDNLIDNGLRYAGEGGSVRLGARRSRLSTELIVADTGPGVDPDDRDLIFEEWARARRERHSRHRGIGLYFCRLAVEAHGGAIRVEGEREDNRFVVSLPVLEDVADKALTLDEIDASPSDIEKA